MCVGVVRSVGAVPDKWAGPLHVHAQAAQCHTQEGAASSHRKTGLANREGKGHVQGEGPRLGI
jgi:hypothetical protein